MQNGPDGGGEASVKAVRHAERPKDVPLDELRIGHAGRAVAGDVARRSRHGDARRGAGDGGTRARLSSRGDSALNLVVGRTPKRGGYGRPWQAIGARWVLCWSYARPSLDDFWNDSINCASVRDRGVEGSIPFAQTTSIISKFAMFSLAGRSVPLKRHAGTE
jgi:hypothetical protein